MLRNNIAGQISQIGLGAIKPATVVERGGDLGQAISEGLDTWDKFSKKKAYIDALQSGDQEKIDNALADYNPESYADVMTAREKRQQDLDDLQAKQDFQREMMDLQNQRAIQLENMRHNNAMGLAQFKASLANPIDTNAQRNVGAMIEAGYTPQEAWAMYYGGNNPTLNMANLGQKAQDKFGTDTGKNYAEDINEYNNLVANYPALEQMTKELSDIADKTTHTAVGKALDVFNRQVLDRTLEGDKNASLYGTKVNQNLLPLLRETFGAAFTEKDREQLQSTLGDPYAPPEIKKNTLNEFIKNKRREIESKKRKVDSYSRPSLMDFNQTPTDWSKASKEDLLKGL